MLKMSTIGRNARVQICESRW